MLELYLVEASHRQGSCASSFFSVLLLARIMIHPLSLAGVVLSQGLLLQTYQWFARAACLRQARRAPPAREKRRPSVCARLYPP